MSDGPPRLKGGVRSPGNLTVPAGPDSDSSLGTPTARSPRTLPTGFGGRSPSCCGRTVTGRAGPPAPGPGSLPQHTRPGVGGEEGKVKLFIRGFDLSGMKAVRSHSHSQGLPGPRTATRASRTGAPPPTPTGSGPERGRRNHGGRPMSVSHPTPEPGGEVGERKRMSRRAGREDGRALTGGTRVWGRGSPGTSREKSDSMATGTVHPARVAHPPKTPLTYCWSGLRDGCWWGEREGTWTAVDPRPHSSGTVLPPGTPDTHRWHPPCPPGRTLVGTLHHPGTPLV